jgi:ketosteroid isomerase-like protein
LRRLSLSSPDYNSLKEVSQANRAFYEAFASGDYSAMVALWLDEDCIRCVHPGGEVLQGRQRVHASWRAILSDRRKMQIHQVDPAFELYGEVAWVTLTERLGFGPAEDRQQAEITATNVYLRKNGLWKMVLHHAGPLARRFFAPEH